MNTYYSTFISGFSEVIEKALKQHIEDVKVITLLDGLVIYESESKPNFVEKLPFFNNSFYLIDSIEKSGSLNDIIESIIGNRSFQIPSNIKDNKKSFRIITSIENTLTAVPKSQLEELERVFIKKLSMDVDRANPDIEVWFLQRSEGYALCGIRLTKKPSTEKYLQKGELRPELAWLLCFLSEPNPSDMFLDPFAGYASIPKARVQFPYSTIIVSDKDFSSSFQRKWESIQIHKWDATKLPLQNNSISKIVTDPPWGIHEKENVEDLYTKMLTEFERVLNVNGILVVLTSQKELFENTLNNTKTLSLKEKYNILVSGKKASVYKIWKK